MAELRIRGVARWVLNLLRVRATPKGASWYREACRSPARAGSREKDELLAELAEKRERLRERYGTLPDSTPAIRAERDAM